MTTTLDEIISIIGKAVILWNRTEYHFERIIWSYTDTVDRIGGYVTTSMGNVSKGKLLMNLVEHLETDERIIESLTHLERCYDICRENRNVMVHGIIHEDATSNDVILLKGKIFGGFAVYEDAATQLKEAADQIAVVYEYCRAMDEYVWRPYLLDKAGQRLPPLALSEKPPLPRKLNLSTPQEDQQVFHHPLDA